MKRNLDSAAAVKRPLRNKGRWGQGIAIKRVPKPSGFQSAADQSKRVTQLAGFTEVADQSNRTQTQLKRDALVPGNAVLQGKFQYKGAELSDNQIAKVYEAVSENEDLKQEYVAKLTDKDKVFDIEKWVADKGIKALTLGNDNKRLKAATIRSALSGIRQEQLRGIGANVDHSTPATGSIVGPQKKPAGRAYKPRNEEERLDQAIRQLATPLLSLIHKSATEVQIAFNPRTGLMLLGTNHPESNEDLFQKLTAKGDVAQSVIDLLQGIEPMRRTKNQKRFLKSEQDNTLKRRTSKIRQKLRLQKKLLELQYGQAVAQFIQALQNAKTNEVKRYNPDDPAEHFQGGGIFVLDQNKKVRNTDTDEHVEVNHFEVIRKMQEEKETTVAGPKVACNTCAIKGRGIVPHLPAYGKIFWGQIPQTAQALFDHGFMLEMQLLGQMGHEASANLQYAQSDSDYESSDDEVRQKPKPKPVEKPGSKKKRKKETNEMEDD